MGFESTQSHLPEIIRGNLKLKPSGDLSIKKNQIRLRLCGLDGELKNFGGFH